ncbi:MAG: amidohydrolase family protein [Halieaceae bacterium]|jgi:imidazolonepropionase-like amidohydrolase|nr:amidohydrolase family protein [Halieaceae bacterium]
MSALAAAGRRLAAGLARTGAGLLLLLASAAAVEGADALLINNVTVIDGTGAAPRRAVSVLIEDGLIRAIGNNPQPPADTKVIEGDGKYLLPGFIDSNVHATVYGNASRRETVVKYGDHNDRLALEFAQRQLKYGVTTLRDSYGALEPLIATRDRINAGEAIGARLLAAGNIVGWGGPFSLTFSLMPEAELTQFQARWNDHIAQGVGEELMDMSPEEVRGALERYIDKGPDFIKYGGTSHFFQPSLITFSPRVQKVIVDVAHEHGLIAETHATSPESLRLALEAGIDLIQHPEILTRAYDDELLDLIIEGDVICALRSNTLTGQPWREHLLQRKRAVAELRDAPPARTSAERRAREQSLGEGYALQRHNAETLIERGCRITIATDNYQGRAPEFRKTPKAEVQEAGIGSILAIEGLVELGMSEMEAIVAATRNGAIAAGMLDRIGTVEVGKEADLLLLDADPLGDIRNIRRLHTVIARGQRIDPRTLPEEILFYTGPRPAGAARVEIKNRPGEAALEAAAGTATVASGVSSDDAMAADAGEASTKEDRSAMAIREVSVTPRGKYLVELENGERWRQLDSDSTRLALPTDRSELTAEFKRSFLGSTMITISGTYRAFKASQVTDRNY